MSEPVSKELLDAGRGYESLFVPALFAEWTAHVVRRADIRDGGHVLDVACGTGVLARDALSQVGPNGRVVGVDPAPGMIAAARELEPGVEWILAGAEALGLGDATFDAVVSQFGAMFFQDRERAAREMLRVLKPGGRLAIAVWDAVENNPAYADVIAILEKNVGTAAADALRAPYAMGDHRTVTAPLESAGFAEIHVATIGGCARFPDVGQMVEADIRGWLPLFDIHLDDAQFDAVMAEADAVLSTYVIPSGEVVFPTAAHVISARKP